MEISSPRNERIKAVERLSKRRERDRSGLIVIEGLREVERALAGGVRIVDAYHCPGDEASAEESLLLARLVEARVPVTVVGPSAFAKIAYREERGGVVAVARKPERALDDLPASEAPLFLVVDAIEKPGNLGALMRSADGAGATGVIVADSATDIYNPNAVRASLGTIFTVPVCAATAAEAARWLKNRGIRIVATSPAADREYTEADLTLPSALVVGSEDRGLGDDWLDVSDATIRIPMKGAADSLNVSAAATILLYEALRQRAASAILQKKRRKERA